MIVKRMRLPNLCSALSMASATLLSGCAGTADQMGEEDPAAARQLWTELAPTQAAADAFFAYDNIIDVTIRFDNYETWRAIKTDIPDGNGTSDGGVCARLPINTNGESPDRFPWVTPKSVVMKDSKAVFPDAGTTFAASDVEIKKKSYCGSLTTSENEQPSLKIKFKNATARDKMGAQYLTLNNSKQDGSWIRQNLGYYLVGLAGLPRPRINYAKVHVVFGDRTTTDEYVAVNVESVRGSFINNPSNGFTQSAIVQSGSSDAKAKGNLYEFTLGAEFNTGGQNEVGTEKVSAIQGSGRPDLLYAISKLANGSASAATLKTIVDVDQFARFWAMEVLLRHWDGYGTGANNTYVYNDVVATSGTQSDSTVNFKFIPYGFDQILQPGSDFRIDENSVVGKILRNDATLYAKFVSAVEYLRVNVFSRDKLDGEIKNRIDALQSQLISLGKDTTAEIDSLRLQLKRARGAAIMLSGSGSSSFYIASKDTGEVIHGSASEVSGIYNEVYHRPMRNDPTDRWREGWNEYGMTLINEGTGKALYASVNLKTPAGNVAIYQEPVGNYAYGEAWTYAYEGEWYSDGRLKVFPGSFKLQSNRTNNYAHYSSTDLTPNGNPRVYQGSATSLFLY